MLTSWYGTSNNAEVTVGNDSGKAAQDILPFRCGRRLDYSFYVALNTRYGALFLLHNFNTRCDVEHRGLKAMEEWLKVDMDFVIDKLEIILQIYFAYPEILVQNIGKIAPG